MCCGKNEVKRCLCQPKCPKPICRVETKCGCGCKKERKVVKCACTPCFDRCANGGFGYGFGSCGRFRGGSCGANFYL